MSDSIEFLRKQAKQLLKQCRAGSAEAIARIRASLPGVSALSDLELITRIKLADVQHVFAREHGVENWTALKSGTDAALEEFLADVRKSDADAVKRQLKKAANEFADENINVACVLGDVDAVASLLVEEPSLATQTHETWSPLHYACASPIHKLSKRHAAGIFHCAELLLRNDLDLTLRSINLAQSRGRESGNHALVSLLARHGGQLSALRAFVPGPSLLESRKREGPLPEVFQTSEFREFLIQRKAQRPIPERSAELKEMMERTEEMRKRSEERMKSSEGARSRMNIHTPKFQQRPLFPPPRPLHSPRSDEDQEFDSLLWAPWTDVEVWRFALNRGLDPNWQGWGRKQTILHRLAEGASLALVTRFDSGSVTRAVEVAELFLACGAQPDIPRDDGQTAYVVSVRSGNFAIAKLLEKHGANTGVASPSDFLADACERMDLEEAQTIVDANAGILDTIAAKQIDRMFQHAERGKVDRIRFMAKLGFDLNRLGECAASLLHVAAWHGQVDLVRLLLEFHASPNVPDIVYGCSPLAWAVHGSANCRDADDDYCSIVDALAANGAQYKAAVNRRGVRPENIATPQVVDALKKNGLTG